MLYTLQIEKCFPDPKHPFSTTVVHYCRTVEEANERRREEKAQYYENYLNFLKESGENVPKDVDEIDEDESQDFIFRYSFMDMAPFSATLYEIQIEDDAITKTRLPFPIPNFSSGESIESE